MRSSATGTRALPIRHRVFPVQRMSPLSANGIFTPVGILCSASPGVDDDNWSALGERAFMYLLATAPLSAVVLLAARRYLPAVGAALTSGGRHGGRLALTLRPACPLGRPVRTRIDLEPLPWLGRPDRTQPDTRDASEESGAGLTPTYAADSRISLFLDIDHLVVIEAIPSRPITVSIDGFGHRGLPARVSLPDS